MVIVEVISENLRKRSPWALLCADDVLLASGDENELKQHDQAQSNRLVVSIQDEHQENRDPGKTGSIETDGVELISSIFRISLRETWSDDSPTPWVNSRVSAQ